MREIVDQRGAFGVAGVEPYLDVLADVVGGDGRCGIAGDFAALAVVREVRDDRPVRAHRVAVLHDAHDRARCADQLAGRLPGRRGEHGGQYEQHDAERHRDECVSTRHDRIRFVVLRTADSGLIGGMARPAEPADIGATRPSEWSRPVHMLPCLTSHALSVPAGERQCLRRSCDICRTILAETMRKMGALAYREGRATRSDAA